MMRRYWTQAEWSVGGRLRLTLADVIGHLRLSAARGCLSGAFHAYPKQTRGKIPCQAATSRPTR